MEQRVQIFRFEHVQIFQDNAHTLGAGSYGAVYKAKCDQLECAAKILHPILFQTRDPDTSRILERFHQECQFMSGIRHPNIVQFLGGTRDPQSGRPVLLMELLDESLTKFLEQSPHSIAYYMEVCLSHDIALALAYLHLNQIIHRDLSSNNVLVLAGSRAKVTDFGMSRLAGDRTDLTQIPGTEVYMPIECFGEQPVYDSKMDVFSLGVIVIQIMTRLFPSPTARFVTHSPEHARIVPETERRREHINLIDDTHPLKSLSLSCLATSKCRPSASQMCDDIANLKTQERYIVSRGEVGEVRGEILAAVQRELTQRMEELSLKDQLIKETSDRLRERESEMATLRDQLEEAQREIKEKAELVERLQGELKRSRGELEKAPLALTWQGQSRASTRMAAGSVVVHEEVAYLRPAGKTQIYSYSHATHEWTELVECKYDNSTLVVIGDNLTTVGGKEGLTSTGALLTYTRRRSHKWEEQWPQMPHPRASPAVISEGAVLVAAGGTLGQNPVVTVEILHTQSRQWQECAELPLPLTQPRVCVANERVFLTGEGESVFSISLSDLLRERCGRTTWAALAALPKANASCDAIDNQLVAVGGRGSGLKATPSNNVYKYDPNEDQWVELEGLRMARWNCFVLSFGQEVMVVGGYTRQKEIMDSVETAKVND